MRRSDEERLKLKAAYLNGLAIAVFAIGGLAPLTAFVYGNAPDTDPILLSFGVLVCALASFALHYVGVRTLRGLDDDDV